MFRIWHLLETRGEIRTRWKGRKSGSRSGWKWGYVFRVKRECWPPRQNRGSIDNNNLSCILLPFPPLHKYQRRSHRVSLVVPFYASGVHPIPYQLSLFPAFPTSSAKIRTIWNPLIPLQTTENCLFILRRGYPPRVWTWLIALTIRNTLPSYYFVRFSGFTGIEFLMYTPYFFIRCKDKIHAIRMPWVVVVK